METKTGVFKAQIVSIRVRRVNEIANRIQRANMYPKIVQKLHTLVLKAVDQKKAYVDIPYEEWRSCCNLVGEGHNAKNH